MSAEVESQHMGIDTITTLFDDDEFRHDSSAASTRLEEFAELSSAWFWETDAKLNFTYVSSRFTEHTGVPQSLVLGTSSYGLESSLTEHRSLDEHHQLLAKRKSFRDAVYSYVHPDGRDIIVSIDGNALMDKGGEFRGFRGSAKIVDQTSVAADSGWTQAQGAACADESPVSGFWERNESTGRYTSCSESLAKMLGTTVQAILRRTDSEDGRDWHVFEADRDKYNEGLAQIQRHSRIAEIRYRIKCGPDAGVDVCEVIEPIFDERGGLASSIGFLRVVSRNEFAAAGLQASIGNLKKRFVDKSAEVRRVKAELTESRSWLRSATQNAKLGYFKRDPVAATGEFCDKEFAKILGASTAECMTESEEDYLARIHRGDVAAVSSAYATSLTEKSPVDIEYRIVRSDGSIRHVHELSIPRTNKQGAIVQVFGTLQDITDRKVIAEELALVEQRLHEIGARAREVLYVLSADWRNVLYVNKAFEQIWGITCDEIVADPKLWYQSLHPEDLDMIVSEIEQKISGADTSPDFSDCRVVGPDGDIFWLSTKVYPIHDEDGAIVRLAGVVEDITARKAATDILYQSRKMEAIGQLTGGIAHDFNNLLAVILGNAELLRETVSADDQLLLSDVITAGTRGAELTKQLLAYSRQQPLHPVLTDVGQLVTGMGELIRRSLGHAIAVEISIPDERFEALVDQGLLENAILNLALNSRDAMPEGGQLKISVMHVLSRDRMPPTLQFVDSSRYLAITMQDSGNGMDSDVLSRATEPFFTTRELGERAGLGLSMVHGYARQSGGDLRLESKPGNGTAATIFLPLSNGEDLA